MFLIRPSDNHNQDSSDVFTGMAPCLLLEEAPVNLPSREPLDNFTRKPFLEAAKLIAKDTDHHNGVRIMFVERVGLKLAFESFQLVIEKLLPTLPVVVAVRDTHQESMEPSPVHLSCNAVVIRRSRRQKFLCLNSSHQTCIAYLVIVAAAGYRSEKTAQPAPKAHVDAPAQNMAERYKLPVHNNRWPSTLEKQAA